MLKADLRSIAFADLDRLRSDRTSESSTLDLKRDLPGTSDRDKNEFLKDVCAFANGDGGDLVYGVAESDGVAAHLQPISAVLEAPDAAMRRLGQVLDAGLEPRVHGIELHSVEGEGGYFLVVRVPRSFDGPHRYHLGHHSRFVVRLGTRTADMTYEQIRAGFDRMSSLATQAEAFLDRRLSAIRSRSTWRPLRPGAVCVLHVVPLAALAGKPAGDVVATFHRHYDRLLFSDWGGGSSALNLDGVVAYPGRISDEGLPAYAQVFRSGQFEAARFAGGYFAEKDGKRVIPSTVVSGFVREAVGKGLDVCRALGIQGPAIVRGAMLQTDGYEFGVGGDRWSRNSLYSDRSDLVLPDAWIEALGSADDVDAVAKPMLDVLWQAFGLERCIEYSRAGLGSRVADLYRSGFTR